MSFKNLEFTTYEIDGLKHIDFIMDDVEFLLAKTRKRKSPGTKQLEALLVAMEKELK